MVTSTGQFELSIDENGRRIREQTIDDPFVATLIRPSGWRMAWRVLRGRYEIVVRVRGKHNAVYRAVMQADYTPDPPREIRDLNSDALMVGEEFAEKDRK